MGGERKVALVASALTAVAIVSAPEQVQVELEGATLVMLSATTIGIWRSRH